MTDQNDLAIRFEEHRPRLVRLAQRMLGSDADADDAVQEAWLRVSRAGDDDVDNFGGWLTTVTSRVCLNALRTRATRNETAYEQGLPDPVVDIATPEGAPEVAAQLSDAVGAALMLVLDRLSPAERVAFVLHDTFDVPFEQIAALLERTPAAARQLASRARRRVQAAGAGGDVDPRRQRPSSTHSSPRPAPAICRVSSPCSTPTSSCALTRPPRRSAWCAAPRRSRATRSCSPTRTRS